MKRKRIALIAHDNLKSSLVDWARENLDSLKRHELYATGTTGSRLEAELGLKVRRFESGPLGGDLQIGAKIVEGQMDLLIFFWDPLSPHSHDVDVKALLRIAVVCDVPLACNRATADMMIECLESAPSRRRPGQAVSPIRSRSKRGGKSRSQRN